MVGESVRVAITWARSIARCDGVDESGAWAALWEGSVSADGDIVVEENSPRQSSGQVVRRYSSYGAGVLVSQTILRGKIV